VAWTRNAVGDYSSTLIGAFPASKTFLMANAGSTVNGWGGIGVLVVSKRISDNVISVIVADAALSGQDNEMIGASIEIIVFP